ncbi:unnamed protein product [Penicillium bialowiezense]
MPPTHHHYAEQNNSSPSSVFGASMKSPWDVGEYGNHVYEASTRAQNDFVSNWVQDSAALNGTESTLFTPWSIVGGPGLHEFHQWYPAPSNEESTPETTRTKSQAEESTPRSSFYEPKNNVDGKAAQT